MLPMFAGIRKRSRFQSARVIYRGELPVSPGAVGAVPGDMIVIAHSRDGLPTTATGPYAFFQFVNMRLSYRILQAGDMSPQITCTFSPCVITIYRGVSNIVQRGTFSTTSSNTMTLAGFAPATNHAGVLVFSEDNSNTVTGYPQITAPSGVARIAGSNFYYNFTYTPDALTAYCLYEFLAPPNLKYAGQSFSSTTNGGLAHRIDSFELLA